MPYGEEFNPYMKFYGLWVPNTIAMSHIPDSSKLLLGRLMQFAGQNGIAYPTRKRLCTELGWGKNKLDRSIKSLKDLKLIKTLSKDPDNHQSPNEYRFLTHSMYDTPLIKSDNTPLIKSDNTPLSNLIGHNKISSIESGPNRITFSKEKGPAGGVALNGLVCKKCGEDQFETRSGVTCKNGHGGVEGIKPKKKILQGLPRIGKIPLKKIQPKGLALSGYSSAAKQILNCWKDYYGKVHLDGGAKGANNIKTLIDVELLNEGLNTCYSKNTNDPELKKKKWMVKEICDCIEFYAGVDGLNKDIESMYFDSFIVMKYNGFKGRKIKNHSPLLDSYGMLPKTKTLSNTAKHLQKWFTEDFPKAKVHPKSIHTISAFLDDKEDDYEIKDRGTFPLMFFNFMKRQVEIEGKYDPIKFMASTNNLEDFFNSLKNRIVKRTPAEKKEWLKQKPIMEENRRKALQKAEELRATPEWQEANKKHQDSMERRKYI